MPRGSRPGERRGGRQRGTPNRKTLLKLAAIDALGPDVSPLEFLLRLMRDPDQPVDQRLDAAAQAAQYVHARPRQAAPDRDSIVRVVENGPHGFGAGAVAQFIKVLRQAEAEAQAKLSGAGAGDEPPDISPLHFMVQAMRDAKVPPAVRIKASRLAARYTHGRQPTADEGGEETRAVVDDRHGFKIPPELAVKFRVARPDVKSHHDPCGSYHWFRHFNGFHGSNTINSKDAYQSLENFRKYLNTPQPPIHSHMKEGLPAAGEVELPASYGFEDFQIADGILKDITSKRMKGPLTDAELFAEAHLLGRRLIYDFHRFEARQRVDTLEEQLEKQSDPEQQKERDQLDQRFPDYKEDPMYETRKAWRKAAAG